MRTRPYRNARIIEVIRDMFFTGGTSSFVNRFGDAFPEYRHRDGVLLREVPIGIVALVATGLYAALKEWEYGTYNAMEFSTSIFRDVYDGHVNTFKHLLQSRGDAYHTMLGDIYAQASTPGIGTTGAPIADLDEIDG
jgi:hypothetical protein